MCVKPFFYRGVFRKCSKCIECRIDKAQDWARRLLLESRFHSLNLFVTLTYNDENRRFTLCKKDLQLFIKRLRKNIKFRYFAAGEYGGKTKREHYHIVLFIDNDYVDKVDLKNVVNSYYYESDLISKCWNFGFVTISKLNDSNALYIAKYTVKKLFSDFDDELENKEKPFLLMSRRPGIAFDFFSNFYNDISKNDFFILNGSKYRSVYFDRKLKEFDEVSYLKIKDERKKHSDILIDRVDIEKRVKYYNAVSKNYVDKIF